MDTFTVIFEAKNEIPGWKNMQCWWDWCRVDSKIGVGKAGSKRYIIPQLFQLTRYLLEEMIA